MLTLERMLLPRRSGLFKALARHVPGGKINMGAIRKGKMSRIALDLAVAITMVLGLMPGAGVGHA